MTHIRTKITLAGLTLLAGCVAPPIGPTVPVMPAPGKPFDVFQQDVGLCEQYASQSIGGAAVAANNQAVGTAVVGTVLGAGLGAAVGGGRGAAIGAASGAVAGTAVGANGAAWSAAAAVRRHLATVVASRRKSRIAGMKHGRRRRGAGG
jgi:hypothetical protein